jgi:hypothetical protein
VRGQEGGQEDERLRPQDERGQVQELVGRLGLLIMLEAELLALPLRKAKGGRQKAKGKMKRRRALLLVFTFSFCLLPLKSD